MANTYTVAGKTTVSGPDCAMYQPGTNFAAVKASGESFAIIKATEGIGYLDPWFTRHAASCNAAGLPWGAYHFARPQNDPVREANWFCQIILANPGWTLPPVLDMEAPGTGAWVDTFCRIVEQRTETPVIYTGAYVAYDRPSTLARYALWIAAYNAGYNTHPNPEQVGNPPLCAPWGRNWTGWQYTSSAIVPGVPGKCDRSVFETTWFHAQLGQAPPTPTPAPTPVPEDDMPYTVEQLTNVVIDAVTKASVFIARDPSDGGIYVFCRMSMDRRHLPTEQAVIDARNQLGIPWLRGDDPKASQDISPSVVHLFAVNEDDVAATVKVDPADVAALVRDSTN